MNRLDITGLARIRLNQLSEFMDGAVYGLGVLHPPGVLAYLSSGQYNAGISHEIKQKGKFPVAQAYGPSAYFRFLPGWVNINVSYREGGCFRAGGIVVMIVFGVSPELSIGMTGNRRNGGLPRNAHIRAEPYHIIYVLIRGAGKNNEWYKTDAPNVCQPVGLMDIFQMIQPNNQQMEYLLLQ